VSIEKPIRVGQRSAKDCKCLFKKNIIRAIKSTRIISTEHVERIGEMKNAYKILVRNLGGQTTSEDLGVDERKNSEWILGKQGAQDRDHRWSLVNTVMNLPVSYKEGEFLE